MALTDYKIDGSGNFTPIATLLGAVEPADTVIYYAELRNEGVQIDAGTMMLVGTEIMRVDEFRAGSVVVGRGCGDTIPKKHAAGIPVWFITSSNVVGRNKTAYASGEEIGVKPLPSTVNQPTLELSKAPAEGFRFAQRFARPYPPGNVQANGSPWYTSGLSMNSDTPLTITWAHRDRVTQADQLVAHSEASVGPETGVTYDVRILNSDGIVVSQNADIAGSSFAFSMSDAVVAFGINEASADPVVVNATARLVTIRAGLEATEHYDIPFKITYTQPYGLGCRLGVSLGGATP